MQIEKCVIYIATLDPMAKANSAIIDGRKKMPVTLPRLKCLEGVYPDKYLPYVEGEPLPLPLAKNIDSNKILSMRESKAYELFKQGMAVKYIARELKTSNSAVYYMIHQARVRLGERPPSVTEVLSYNHVKDLSPLQKQTFELYKSGMSFDDIARKIKSSAHNVRGILYRIKQKKDSSHDE